MGYPTDGDFAEARRGPDPSKWHNFDYVSKQNLERCKAWHPNGLKDWSETDWACAMAGEAGELCNVIKKLRRLQGETERVGRGTRNELLAQAATEIGDTYIYLDLLCQRLSLDMWTCISDSFNRVSERENLPQRLE